jgi:hypothetical protein
MKIIDIFETDAKFRTPTIEESVLPPGMSNRIKNNPSIIGIIEGCHFVPGGISRNGRYYPENERYGYLWRDQLNRPEIKEILANKTMYGCISHIYEMDDNTFAEGKVSHFTTDAKIIETGNPKQPYIGWARSYILDTPSGRLLKTYFEGAGGLHCSTRADGEYICNEMYLVEESGQEVPILDPKIFRWERVDFVRDAGFLLAKSELVKETSENYNEFINGNNTITSPIKENDSMSVKKPLIVENDPTNPLIQKSAGDMVIKVTADNEVSITKAQGVSDTATNTDAPHNKAATATSATDQEGAAEVTFGNKEQNTTAESLLVRAMDTIDKLKAENAKLRKANEAVASDAEPDVKGITQDILDDQLTKIDPENQVANPENKADLIKDLKTDEAFIREAKKGDRFTWNNDPEVFTVKKVHSDGSIQALNSNGEEAEFDVEELEDIVWESSSLQLKQLNKFIREVGPLGKIRAYIREAENFHKEVGTFKDTREVLNRVSEYTKNVGLPNDIITALESLESICDKIGSPQKAVEVFKAVESFCKKYGNFSAIAKNLDKSEQFFKENGSPAELMQNMKLLENLAKTIEGYKKLGFGNMQEVKNIMQKLKNTKFENQALRISQSTGFNLNVVKDYLNEGLSAQRIAELANTRNDKYFDKYATVNEDMESDPNLGLLSIKTVDPDGDNQVISNVSYKSELPESATTLDRMVSKLWV